MTLEGSTADRQLRGRGDRGRPLKRDCVEGGDASRAHGGGTFDSLIPSVALRAACGESFLNLILQERIGLPLFADGGEHAVAGDDDGFIGKR